MTSTSTTENPREAEAKPPFPQESLEYPGLESEMTPGSVKSCTRVTAACKGKSPSSPAATAASAARWPWPSPGRGPMSSSPT